MSRVGKVPVKILQGVKVDIKDGLIKIEGPKGKVSHQLARGVTAKVDNGSILIVREDQIANNASALQGMTRTVVHNMVHGVHTGFTRELEVVGVGYRASMKGQLLTMLVGYSHPVEYEIPQGVTGKVEANTKIVVTGADKMLVGLVAAKIRSFKKPEPYQGKGVKYSGEHIIRKQGKAAGAK
ncbi:MAG: 50S ribosomal protein L6 [Bdellovibrionota bacterium]